MSDMPFDNEVYSWVPEPKKYYNLSRLACNFDSKVALISMVCSLKQAFKKSGKNLTTIELINKLVDDDFTTKELKEEIADICDAFYSDEETFNNFGCKSAKEIKIEVKKILYRELPF